MLGLNDSVNSSTVLLLLVEVGGGTYWTWSGFGVVYFLKNLLFRSNLIFGPIGQVGQKKNFWPTNLGRIGRQGRLKHLGRFEIKYMSADFLIS